MSVVVLVGNPKPQSRTLAAGSLLASELIAALPKLSGPPTVIDAVTLGPGLLGWGDPDVAAALSQIRAAQLLIVASPTFKATYTGLVKLVLDQIPADGLAGVVAVPLMLGAGPRHALAPELLLKPVLVELGATCPAPGLYLMDSTYDSGPELGAWVTRWGGTLG